MSKQRAKAQDMVSDPDREKVAKRYNVGRIIDDLNQMMLDEKPHRYTVIIAGIPYSIEADYYGISDGVALFYKDNVKEPVQVAEFNASKIDGIIEEGV